MLSLANLSLERAHSADIPYPSYGHKLSYPNLASGGSCFLCACTYPTSSCGFVYKYVQRSKTTSKNKSRYFILSYAPVPSSLLQSLARLETSPLRYRRSEEHVPRCRKNGPPPFGCLIPVPPLAKDFLTGHFQRQSSTLDSTQAPTIFLVHFPSYS